ncbi:hypothetical protein BVRB_1g011110 [Beta vulgaris subsp. vulgaris]|nr:hypothetical protein BVRB_1g011110 [Beta vulgaris subsp. vulgaris]
MLDTRTLSDSVPFTELPENLDQLISLRCLSLWHLVIMSVPQSIAKLSHLETLNLYYSYFQSPLPKSLKLLKLKLSNSCIDSVPIRLWHLEIGIFSKKATDTYILEQHFSQLATLETLSISCYNVKFLPSITGLHNLRELMLNGCFNLRELPANLNELVNLSTLNINDTRIKIRPL